MSKLAQGQLLDKRFRLLHPLAEGGMGEVWLADDRELEEKVVVKTVPASASEEQMALLKRECRHARRLVHPNIVPVYDFHRREDGLAFLSMQHVEGTELAEYRLRAPADILRLVKPLAEALAYAHREGVVHRDVKAENVIVDATGSPRLLDFGISDALTPRADDVRLVGGGSLYNVSPQQLDGAPPSASDDIYGLGTLLYELLAGNPPFWPEGSSERIRSELPPAVRSKFPLPDKLVSLVASMLEKEPDKRPSDMTSVVSALEKIEGELARRAVRLTPPPRVEPSGAASGTRVNAPKVRPRSIETQAPPPAARARLARPGIGLGTTALFAVLLGGLFLVFFLLPRWVGAPSSAPGAVVPVAPPAEPAQKEMEATPTGAPSVNLEELRDLAVEKDRAETARDRARERLATLEAKSVSLWGGQAYRDGSNALSSGESLLERQEYLNAESAFQRALESFEREAARSREVLRDALARGLRALTAGSATEATTAFELASKIEPGNAEAARGLKRVGVIDEVFGLVAEGQAKERSGDLVGAVAAYRRATSLDPLYEPAHRALSRLDARVTEEKFTAAMTEGVTALERSAFLAAKEAFERARAIRPDAIEIADGIVRAEEGIKLERIASHRDKATGSEAEESWRRAEGEYQAVLEIDPNIRFAQDGIKRAGARAELDERLEFHLKNPGRLSEDKVLEEASLLLERGFAIEPAGPRLRRQVARMEALVATAATPVNILIESDSLTDVTVYKVGRLGRFERRELELRPGTYTVVGTRNGYRDVRLNVVVEPDATRKAIVIRCEEKI